MNTHDSNWTRPEFKAYLMSYAAQANFFESEEEKEEIIRLFSGETYKRVHKELEKDNDYQSLQKIMYNIEKFQYSKDDLDKLVADIRHLFDADGTKDILEENMLFALKKLFRSI